ncbi:Phosphatidylinositol transfer protein (PITP) [Tilletia horrida]|uniref:Phosphatidylinositol transfer protein (PITP) n=1 Tax=Tilletia horrida TaxID=155126 RepID=A0AAN6JQR1_9BASI|nr:Phosphatidylinositol transfer protein (PITP) [Tilletia horrida]KAK0564673.1 Phosphatidylinositol transfer protein (PITP) [Tilletia horrida]
MTSASNSPAGGQQQQQHQHQHHHTIAHAPQELQSQIQHQQHPRTSMLTRAFNSLQLGRKTGHQSTHSITSTKFFDPSGNDADSIARKGSALSQTPKQLHAFAGVFPTPAPGCSPTEPPPQHVKLTPDQARKYEVMLQHFSDPETPYPVAFGSTTEKRKLNEHEIFRLLTRESMLRYLRASKWDLATAKKRLTDTIIWRREYGVDNLDSDYVEPEAICGKETILGFDKRGRPLHYMTPHLNNTKESPRQMKFAVWILERAIDLMPPGVEQLALLINFQHKSRNPTSIANAKLMLYILQNHYVERLGIALCINVPWIFKTFYAAVQPFIDPVTREKVQFDEAIKQEVPLDQLNSDYGGNVDPTYEHEKYWPDLIKTCERRREKDLERFRTLCDGKIGASEWVIRGGDPSKAPEANLVLTNTASTAQHTDAKGAAEVTTGEKVQPGAPVDIGASAAADGQPPSAEPTSTTSAVQSTKDQVASTVANVAAAAKPVAGSLMQYAQTAAQTAVATAGAGASVAESVVAKLASGVIPADGSKSAAQVPTSASETEPIHSADLAVAPPSDVPGPSTPGETLLDGSKTAAASMGAPPAPAAAPALQGEQQQQQQQQRLAPSRPVTVLYFAAARSAAGVASVQISIPADASSSSPASYSGGFSLADLPKLLVDDTRRRVNGGGSDEGDAEELERVLDGVQYSVDQVMLDREELKATVLWGGEEVGVIPPVSGG